MPTPLLELEGVSKAFGGLRVIDGLDLVVNEREVVSVIGPNGAGKTTLFNLITGIYRPDEGEIRLDGQNLVGLAPQQDHEARGRAHVPDAAALPEHVRQGERHGRAVRPHEGGAAPLDSAHARDAPRGEGDLRRAPRRSSPSSASG